MDVFGKSVSILAKVVVFGQKWVYLEKCFFWAKVVVFGQKWLYSGKVVVVGQK